MKRYLLFFAGIFLFLILFAESSFALNCSGHPGYHRLFCRGKMGILTGGSTPNNGLASTNEYFKFRANPTVAGAGGVSLQPGTCSWVDRPIAATEPRMTFIDMQRNDFVRLNGEVMRDCLGDKDCVVEFCATNVLSPFLNVRVFKHLGHIMTETHYPFPQ